MKEEFPWIVLLYVPAGCTGKLQVCDTVINFPFKNKGKQQAVAFVCYKVRQAIREASEKQREGGEGPPAEGLAVEVDLRLTALKPRLPMWIKRSIDHLKTPEMRMAIVR